MALNIAVPLATTATSVADLMDGFGLLSPISPLSVDCREVLAAAAAVAAAGGTNPAAKKQLVSPVGSESSGVSSLDSDEMKKPTPPTTPTEEVDRPAASSPLPEADESGASSSTSTRSSLSSESDSGSSEQESSEVVEEPEQPPKECKLVLGGRDVLNLMDNLTAPNHFRLQFAQLPENDNIHFFLDNRSQYHRLGANGHIQEYTMVGCNRCDFRYPVNGTSLTSGGPTATMGQSSLAAAFPQQQQQQQQQLQWNNLNSIANSRDKMGLNAAANAFTSTSSSKFGGGNQYFRNGGGGGNAMALFGRDSNRGAANFLTANSSSNSTGTYNNHKTYQQQQQLQSFGNKFNSYQQQQQQFFSKNQPLRYGQSSGSGFNAMAAALAANQNLVNFNSFSGKNSSQSSAASNNNNMFAYYKTMM